MKHRRDAGFSLAALIFFATAASILAAAAYPAYQMQAKRDIEEELIFRGEEYTRAIQKYQRRFGIYPTSVEQLLETNGIRFLRRQYKDPITDKEFRLIYINPDGSLTGSKMLSPTANNSSPFGGNPFGASPFGNTTPSTGATPPRTGGSPAVGPGTSSTAPRTPATGSTPGTPSTGSTPAGGSTARPTGAGSPGGSAPGGAGVGRPAGGPGTTIIAGGIIGVGSDSELESIKVYNQRQKYDEWEFIAILGQPGTGGVPGGAGPGGAGPGGAGPGGAGPGGVGPGGVGPGGAGAGGRPGSPNSFGTSPFGPAGGSPFGAPAGSPAGGQPRPPASQPFGFGNPPQANQPAKK